MADVKRYEPVVRAARDWDCDASCYAELREDAKADCVLHSDIYPAPRADVERLVEAAKAVDEYDWEHAARFGLGSEELDVLGNLLDALAALEAD